MEPTTNEQLLREIHRLTLENNQMLHRARRTAFAWGFVKFIIYILFLLGPIWFYMTYLSGTVQQILNDYNKMEGINAQGQSQLQQLQEAWLTFQQQFHASSTQAR
ncbi:MAG TPA: hypothetical protein VMU25_00300 [Candidatus Paceibacterota bacterium]|nr:hypothetical protein [Candidatus Paceibacterota bacterium]